jgi:hypothetical protein
VNIVQMLYTHVCKWKKKRPVETILRMGREGKIKDNDEGGEFKHDIFNIS